MSRYVLLAAFGALLAAGCATTTKSASTDDDDKTYVTGSRIPVKDGSVAVRGSTDKQQIDDMVKRTPVTQPKGTN